MGETETIRAALYLRSPVFRFLTNILTATAILTHSLFGCCGHSADAHESTEVVAECHTCCCSHGCSTQQASNDADCDYGSQESSDDHERKHCHDETCSFVGSSLVKLQTPFELPMLDLLPADAAPMAGHAVLDRIILAADGNHAGIPLTLRAQQWLGVWLI
jgi:hypothetical protein